MDNNAKINNLKYYNVQKSLNSELNHPESSYIIVNIDNLKKQLTKEACLNFDDRSKEWFRNNRSTSNARIKTSEDNFLQDLSLRGIIYIVDNSHNFLVRGENLKSYKVLSRKDFLENIKTDFNNITREVIAIEDGETAIRNLYDASLAMHVFDDYLRKDEFLLNDKLMRDLSSKNKYAEIVSQLGYFNEDVVNQKLDICLDSLIKDSDKMAMIERRMAIKENREEFINQFVSFINLDSSDDYGPINPNNSKNKYAIEHDKDLEEYQTFLKELISKKFDTIGIPEEVSFNDLQVYLKDYLQSNLDVDKKNKILENLHITQDSDILEKILLKTHAMNIDESDATYIYEISQDDSLKLSGAEIKRLMMEYPLLSTSTPLEIDLSKRIESKDLNDKEFLDEIDYYYDYFLESFTDCNSEDVTIDNSKLYSYEEFLQITNIIQGSMKDIVDRDFDGAIINSAQNHFNNPNNNCISLIDMAKQQFLEEVDFENKFKKYVKDTFEANGYNITNLDSIDLNQTIYHQELQVFKELFDVETEAFQKRKYIIGNNEYSFEDILDKLEATKNQEIEPFTDSEKMEIFKQLSENFDKNFFENLNSFVKKYKEFYGNSVKESKIINSLIIVDEKASKGELDFNLDDIVSIAQNIEEVENLSENIRDFAIKDISLIAEDIYSISEGKNKPLRNAFEKTFKDSIPPKTKIRNVEQIKEILINEALKAEKDKGSPSYEKLQLFKQELMNTKMDASIKRNFISNLNNFVNDFVNGDETVSKVYIDKTKIADKSKLIKESLESFCNQYNNEELGNKIHPSDLENFIRNNISILAKDNGLSPKDKINQITNSNYIEANLDYFRDLLKHSARELSRVSKYIESSKNIQEEDSLKGFDNTDTLEQVALGNSKQGLFISSTNQQNELLYRESFEEKVKWTVPFYFSLEEQEHFKMDEILEDLKTNSSFRDFFDKDGVPYCATFVKGQLESNNTKINVGIELFDRNGDSYVFPATNLLSIVKNPNLIDLRYFNNMSSENVNQNDSNPIQTQNDNENAPTLEPSNNDTSIGREPTKEDEVQVDAAELAELENIF